MRPSSTSLLSWESTNPVCSVTTEMAQVKILPRLSAFCDSLSKLEAPFAQKNRGYFGANEGVFSTSREDSIADALAPKSL